jgi:hypothetical protein
MEIRMQTLHTLLPLLAGVFVASAGAAPFDGSKPLICATQHVMDVASPQQVTAGLPADMGAPAFMRVDFEKKTISGPRRTTAVRVVEKMDNQMVLQGIELGLGWTLAVDRNDGSMTGSMVDARGAIVLFGSCTHYEQEQ